MRILLILAALIFAPASAQGALTVEVLPAASVRSVAIGAQRVPMLQLRLTAPCGKDITLTSITVTHEGLGSPRDIARVYAHQNGRRITRGIAPASRDGTAMLQLRGRTVPACGSATFDILADFSAQASAAGEHSFTIRSASDIVADIPVSLAQRRTPRAVTRPVGQATTTVIVEYPDLPAMLTYGDKRTVSRLRLRGDPVRDQRITAVTFTNDGSARDADVRQLFLETGSHERVCGPVAQMEGDQVRLTCENFALRRNEVRVLSLKGNIRARRKRTIRFLIEEPSDIEAIPGR